MKVGLVPTMGALHDGHRALLRAARAECDRVVMSLFVNPAQFGPGEDLDRYPRDEAGDRAIAAAEGVDEVYAPSVDEMYPAGFAATVSVGKLGARYEGHHRPGHFDGVATVVLKLFARVRPNVAYFGRKDAQQLAVVRRMALDLDFDVEVVGMPIVREPDGLAMSSRNAYLSAEQRGEALSLSRGLAAAANAFGAGERDAGRLVETARRLIGGRIDYVEMVDAETLQPVATVTGPAVIAAAAFYGTTRLIDNRRLG